jgi:CheY-like chemotaxis protein
LTGFTREDVIGKTSLEINIWHNPKKREKLVRGLQKNGYYDNLEAKFCCKDGSLTTALMSARVILLKNVPHIIIDPDPKTIDDLKGSETILITEDDEHVRHLSHDILKRQGYTILLAKSGTEALKLLREYLQPVHLLLTDVVMPEMNGKELYSQATIIKPTLKVVYMSGYTGNVIVHHGVLEKGVPFIQKPFSADTLSSKVRKILDETSKS